MKENLIRLWFGAVRAAADAGESALPEKMSLSPLQKTKLQILLRQDLCDSLAHSIQNAEGIGSDMANQIYKTIYSELMEDAVAGVWNEEENLDLACFLSQCSEGVANAEVFCASFRSILDQGDAGAQQELDAMALQIKNSEDKRLNTFIKARERQNAPKPAIERESPPPGMDEFEYIDWLISN